MKTPLGIGFLALLLALPLAAEGVGRHGLILNAEGLRELTQSFGANYDLYNVPAGEDRRTISDFYLYHGQNRYSLTLEGETGRTVTLFAQPDFGKGAGYLIIRKKDDQTIWLRDLMTFPPNTWHGVAADNRYGAYEVFYHPAPRFDQNITSVKWGQWWQGERPGS